MFEKFTPGPWSMDSTGSVVNASGGYVAEAFDGLPGSDTDQEIASANARLVAAAPELFEALTLFVDQWNACGPNSDFGRYFQNVRDAARTALLKASPEQSE